ncbi:DinB family protein [Danxiaibacter flavus]|uniref:DinB family protein n=1 Tax=Danxiaibacter flavus TaxID=3049108 RepID=A0ABV3ZGV5_9BACT|nr:DinB family protein [Chitinophagaceae bacterium DXS]
MGIAQMMLPELKHEAANTRKILERLKQAEDKFEWRPHQKSYTMGQLASHIANLTTWITMTINSDELDLASSPRRQPLTGFLEVLEVFEKNLDEATKALEGADDSLLMKKWTLRKGDHVILELPKAAVIRSMVFNHVVHHRGQLTVYLRLNDLAVPGMYGPSADEQ